MVSNIIDKEKFPMLASYAKEMLPLDFDVNGRDLEIELIQDTFARAIVSNIFLLGDAGVGKTTLVRSMIKNDPMRRYLEIDLTKMTSIEKDGQDASTVVAERMQALLDEVEVYGKMIRTQEGVAIDLVLFIDEFHLLPKLSEPAVEAMKPALADSVNRGIRVIAATTFDEYVKYNIEENQPFIERFVQVKLDEPSDEDMLDILKQTSDRILGVGFLRDDSILRMIIEMTNRYIPASSQPRKGLMMFDAMVGAHRNRGLKFDKKLLADTIYNTIRVNIAFRTEAQKVEEYLNNRVYDQTLATKAIEMYLQVVIADLYDKTRPMASFLLTGSTGVGKMLTNDTPVPTPNGWVNHGDLMKGDMVFDRYGNPTRVLDTFKHKDVPIYAVELADGRVIEAGDEHLWAVYSKKQRYSTNPKPRVMSTIELLNEGVFWQGQNSNQKEMKWYIPSNGAVQYNHVDLELDPYVMGSLIANGSLREKVLVISTDDDFIVNKVSDLINADGYIRNKHNYSWSFPITSACNKTGNQKYIQTKHLNLYGIDNSYAVDKFIPDEFMINDIDSRWKLIQGLFDNDGSVGDNDRCNIMYHTNSERLANDVRTLILSLGFGATVSSYDRSGRSNSEFVVRVKASREDKLKFFTLPRKRAIIEKWIQLDSRVRVKKFDMVGIRSITYLRNDDAQCIYVDNDEHLYQAGEFVVTHNTELCKALATVMFGNENKLQRYDMSEYSEAHRVNALREDITNGAKRQAYGIILLDEIEKAHPDCTRLLLQVLDDARLSDKNGREVSFKNMYIMATTNVGSATYESIASYLGDDGSPTDKAIRAYKPLIRRALISSDSFPTELVNRFNAFIPFVPLADRTKNKIAKAKLDKIKKEVEEKHGLTLKVGGDVATWLVYQRNESAANAGGGRGIANTINEDILAAVSRSINLKLYDEKTRTLWMAVDPDVTTSKIALKKDLQFTYGGTRVDESTVYIGHENVARALIKKNEIAIKAWKQRVLKGLQ